MRMMRHQTIHIHLKLLLNILAEQAPHLAMPTSTDAIIYEKDNLTIKILYFNCKELK